MCKAALKAALHILCVIEEIINLSFFKKERNLPYGSLVELALCQYVPGIIF